MRRIVALAGLVLALCPLTARAQLTDGVTDHDVQFVYDAALNNVSEIVLGRLAADLATSEEVRAFGARMVADHTQAHADLLAVAEAAGIALPAALAAPPPQAELPPADDDAGFDATYLSGQILAHRRAIALFERGACRAGNTQLQAFALAALPVLEQHLADAMELLPLAVAIEQDDPRGLDCPIGDDVLPPAATPTPDPDPTATPGPGGTPTPIASPTPTSGIQPPTPTPGAFPTPDPGASPGGRLIFPRSNGDHPRLRILP